MEVTFNQQLSALIKNKNHNCVYMSENQYNIIIQEVSEAKSKTKKKSDKDYRRLHRYDVIVVGKKKKLISPLNKKNKNIRYFVSVENLFEVIHNAHLTTGHGGRNKMLKEINENYKNVTVDSIMLYLSLCEACRKAKNKKKSLPGKPILASELNSRCQVNLIDLQTQPDADYKFVLNYQDHLTKFVLLKPLKTKTAPEVAHNLMEIFTTFGAPSILHSDNGKEFVNKIISELTSLWDGLKIIRGTPRDVERSNQDVENMIFTWMDSNKNTKWSEGLKYVQLMKNRSYHDGIKKTPYEAMFGSKMKLGLKSSSFPSELIDAIHTEEDLAAMINKDLTINQEASSGTSNNENAGVVLEELSAVKIEIDPTVIVNEMDGDLLQDFKEESLIYGISKFEMDTAENEDILINVKAETQTFNQDYLEEDVTQVAENKERTDIAEFESENAIQKNEEKSEILPLFERKALKPNKRRKAREDLNAHAKKIRVLSKKLSGDTVKIPKESNAFDVDDSEKSLKGDDDFKRCNCKNKCETKKCSCKASNILCNSKCHGSTPCSNKN